MKFSLSDEQREIVELAARILNKQLTDQRLVALDKAEPGERFDPELWSELAKAGLLGVAIDEAYGGMGFGFFELALLLEGLGRAVAPTPAVPVLAGAAELLQSYGTPAQREALLPGIAKGEIIVSLALAEMNNPSQREAVITQLSGSDEALRLNGTKHYVPFARQASQLIVSAVDAGGQQQLVLVDVDAPGVSLSTQIATNAEPTFIVQFDDVALDAKARLGSTEQWAEAVATAIDSQLVAYSVTQLGATDAALRMTAKYTAEREQFNVAIATFQAVAHRAADAYIDVECLRLCSYQAASMFANRGASPAEQSELSDAVMMAKIWAGDVGHRVSYACQHLHGGTGVDRDYPLWRYCLLMRQIEFTLGHSQQQLVELGDKIAATGVAMT